MSTIGTVKVIRIRFREDDVFDGSLPWGCYENALVEEFECDDIDEAVRVIQREGVTFEATGAAWAADPDGSRIVDYGEGIREETSAHLDGFTVEDETTIMDRVG